MLLTVAKIATILSGCSAGPHSPKLSDGLARSTLVSCGPGPPAVMLHRGDGRVIAASRWHPASSGTRGGGERTLDFSFAVEPGAPYLTMNNEHHMPTQDRQIELAPNQVATSHVVACVLAMRRVRGILRRRSPRSQGRGPPGGVLPVRTLFTPSLVVPTPLLGSTGGGASLVRDSGRHAPTRISLIGTFALSNVTDVVPGALGLYVLRGAPFPGDASGDGWEVDLISPTSGRILESVSGDAAPTSLVLAFGSVWVSTGSGAMAGGLGPGIDRLDAMTLTHEARMNIAPRDVMSIAATSSSLWILEGGDHPKLEAIDPATDAIAQTKTFAENDLVEGLTATADRVIVSYEPFGSPPRLTARTYVTWIDASSLRVRSSAVVARTPATAGSAQGAYSLAATNDTTVYVGLEGARTGPSLVVLRGRSVLRSRRGTGDLVTASRDGEVWAAAIQRQKGGPDTSDLQRIAGNGTVSSQRSGLPAFVSISGKGDDLYAGASAGVLVFKG